MLRSKLDMTGAPSARAGGLSHEPAPARRFEALIFDWDRGDEPHDRGAEHLGATIEEACAHGLELAIVSRMVVGELDAVLAARPAGAGGLILATSRGGEVFSVDRDGLKPAFGTTARITGDVQCREVEPTNDARWVMPWLWRCGIAPEQVLIAGGRDVMVAVLQDQIARRRAGELPIAAEDPSWTLVVEGIDPRLERVNESLLTIGAGQLGTRGSIIVPHPSGDPAVMMSGIYARAGAESHMLAGPRWHAVPVEDAAHTPVRRVLDLRGAVLRQEIDLRTGRIEALLFCSLARPRVAVLRARGPIDGMRVVQTLEPPPGVTCEQGEHDGAAWMRATSRPASVVAALHGRLRGRYPERVLDRVAAYEGAATGPVDHRRALNRLRGARKASFDALLAEHRRAWAWRWDDADVVIEGDPELQLATRVALFHLMANVPDVDEAAVGARGLTGRAYRGHVFWDSDVYMLPFLAATHPAAARAMLEYRVRRLPAALRAARAAGRAGARFPWESARSGEDVTPEHLRDHRGELVPVLTGQLEEHIVADVAWGAAWYTEWTGDSAFAAAEGRDLIVQTARWWASRIELDPDGRGHLRGVIGPDEYHVGVDDNAFTNVMARWNLRQAAKVGADEVDERERRRWLELADAIVDGYDAQTGVYEQFAGFHALEPLLIGDIAPQRPVAADMLLGHERVSAAQVLKQADVLMLHYLVPDEVAAGSLEPNLDFYEPRTAHGSTLSPGVHAALLARAGRLEQALEMLRLTSRIDLDDIGDNTGGGLHLAAMGSVWRALAFGFAGLRPIGGALAIDPVLAPGWDALELRVRFRGSRVHVRVEPTEVMASADPPVHVLDGENRRIQLGPVPRMLHSASTRRSSR
jgi:trehalose/maltose hydrolase-like predicted phosphorylase